MARSITASRSNRQFSACLTISSSMAVVSFTAPSNKRFANVRVESVAFAARQNFASSFVGSCSLMSHWNSICIANSRDFVRRDMLFAPRLSGGGWLCFRAAQFARQLRHLNRRKSRFESFVAALEPRAIDGLFQSVASQHAKDNRHTRIHLRKLQPARRLRANIIVMRRFAANHAPNRDQRIVAPCHGKLLRRQRQFERTRHMHDVHVFARSASALQRIHRRCQQPLSNKTIEPAHHNPKSKSRRAQPAVNFPRLHFSACPPLCETLITLLLCVIFSRSFLSVSLRSYFPTNFGGLFSKNAFVPSRISSVAQAKPKSVASRNNPSSCGISMPRSMASIVYFTAIGAFAIIFLASASAAGKSSAAS